ncbi:MAG TPA: DUF1648 domain-containing protein [Microbacterium sp.]|nr:DUF1648 domain-containing protein [Microbacterium sp.]
MTNATPADRSDLVIRRFVLVAVWVPVVLVAVGVAVQLVLLPQMPSTVAVHWNAAGEADGFAPAWTQPLMTSLLGLAVPFLIALMTLPGLRRGERGQTYRLLGAAAAAVSALTTTLATWTFAMQTGPDGADEVPMIGLPLVGSLVVAGVVGIAAWLIQPRQGAADAAAPPATPLALAASERAVWVQTTAMNLGGAIAVVAAVLAVAVAAIVAWTTGAEPLLGWILTGIALLLLVFAATTLAFHVRVDDTGVHVDSVLGLPRFRVPLSEVASAARVEVNPMGEFGGWGVRIAPHGRRFGIVLRTGEALEVARSSGRRFVVTVDDAATGAALLEALVERASARS